jgi:hypothetical protein
MPTNISNVPPAAPAPIEPDTDAGTAVSTAKWKTLLFSKSNFLILVIAAAGGLLVVSKLNGGDKPAPPALSAAPAMPAAGSTAGSAIATQAKTGDSVIAAPAEVTPNLAQLAADTALDNAAFPAGSGKKEEKTTQSGPSESDGHPAPAVQNQSKITRFIKEPNQANSASSANESSPSSRRSGHTAQIAPAGMPAIRSNGQQQLHEVMGKQRSDSRQRGQPASTSPGTAGSVGEPSSRNPQSEDTPKLDDDFAPYGRLVKCELVFTVDSVNLGTPIVGLVMEDVWWNGKLIIPAGAEAFSKAVPRRVLNRIGDDGKWTFVMPEQDERINGRELLVNGFALDRAEVRVEPNGRVRAWNLNDGSAGLQGYVVDNADPDKIKLFIATALSGAISGFADGLETRETSDGLAGTLGLTQVKSNLQNSLVGGVGQGSKKTLDLLAKQILEEIQQNGAYVRVPSGKQFYVFIDQTIDPATAKVGNRLPQQNAFP